ncbi:MAG: hypothetical protein GX895_03235 [Clostridiales bacterium]|uniref:hypothetical protein n=1 Tax=Clostridium sp. N3C TaxID=1776758 RepID=UPI00094508B5|nr:hypothetical protein [Clostridium sp. N3C]NLZ47795.1 hypothetical protein [Clostridiales bacterium]
MNHKSHVDIDKLNKIPKGRSFEYKDVVCNDFPDEEHAEDGKIFKTEVENNVFSNVIVQNDNANTTVKYKKV